MSQAKFDVIRPRTPRASSFDAAVVLKARSGSMAAMTAIKVAVPLFFCAAVESLT